MFDDPGGLRTTGLPRRWGPHPTALRRCGYRAGRRPPAATIREGPLGDRAGQLAVIRLIRRHPGDFDDEVGRHVAPRRMWWRCAGGDDWATSRTHPGPDCSLPKACRRSPPVRWYCLADDSGRRELSETQLRRRFASDPVAITVELARVAVFALADRCCAVCGLPAVLVVLHRDRSRHGAACVGARGRSARTRRRR